jgi:hypothetical protein
MVCEAIIQPVKGRSICDRTLDVARQCELQARSISSRRGLRRLCNLKDSVQDPANKSSSVSLAVTFSIKPGRGDCSPWPVLVTLLTSKSTHLLSGFV